jgi:hypothetical protein
MFKAGLAYEKEMPINWCPSCKTGVNKPFKAFMHEEWAKWIEAPTHHVTPAFDFQCLRVGEKFLAAS